MITFITERLAVGSIADARHLPEEISAILNVADEINHEENDRIYHKIPMKEMTPASPQEMSEAVNWIKENILQHHLLVFCNAGVQRAPSVIVAYLCSAGFGYDEALIFISDRVSEFVPLPYLMGTIEDCMHFYL